MRPIRSNKVVELHLDFGWAVKIHRRVLSIVLWCISRQFPFEPGFVCVEVCASELVVEEQLYIGRFVELIEKCVV
jgi:hypothetical protein